MWSLNCAQVYYNKGSGFLIEVYGGNDKLFTGSPEELDPKEVKRHLRETGAWENKDLKNHYTNLKRILWLAFTDIVAEEEEKALLKRIQNF